MPVIIEPSCSKPNTYCMWNISADMLMWKGLVRSMVRGCSMGSVTMPSCCRHPVTLLQQSAACSLPSELHQDEGRRAASLATRLKQLVNNAGVCKGGSVAQLGLLLGCNLAQHPPHDLPRPCLGQSYMADTQVEYCSPQHGPAWPLPPEYAAGTAFAASQDYEAFFHHTLRPSSSMTIMGYLPPKRWQSGEMMARLPSKVFRLRMTHVTSTAKRGMKRLGQSRMIACVHR